MARQERHQPSGCIMSLLEMPWVQTRRVSLRWQTGESGSRFDPGSSKFSTKLELPQPARVAETATALALRRRWLILGVVLVGSFMAILDVFIVTQGLPSIKTSLGAGVADLELVVSAYSLVYAVFLITGGRLGDILDRKRIFLSGMTVFTVASALAGYAPSAAVLIGARALQGLGAALMYPQVLSIIQVTFKGSERSLALGLFAATSGIGAITGNIVGGLLIQLNLAGLSWRPIFLVNVPVGIIGVLAGFLVLHPSRTERAPKLDLPGVGLISLFLVSLVLPLAEGQQTGWPNWMIMLLILSFPVLALFVIYERKRTKNGEDPLVDMDLFKHRSFAVGIPLTLLYYVTASGLFFTLVLFLQSGLGFSPIISGLSFAQLNIGFITASLLGPRLIRSFGNRVLSLAYILQTAGLGWIILTLNSYGASLTLYELSPPLIVFGAGAGFALSPLLGVILSGVPSQEAGEASGVVSTSFQIGNTVGISLFGHLYYRFLNGQQSPTSYIDAFKTTVPFFVILSVAGFLLVFLLSQHRARQIIHRLEA
ncbi:MFS transporter [Candidatus Bathyarchaeota archaeon]|nr:MAG: MFS transporter [Candidatus Bathyarchaeota archaeon]